VGPFQLEAAIQATHCYRARTGEVPWKEIALLYGTLVERFPTVGARVGHAVAIASAERAPVAGLTLLGALPAAEVRDYQPYWVALSHLHELAGQPAPSRQALTRDLGLSAWCTASSSPRCCVGTSSSR
jgi:RNA polymerase sigma-70 factor, ECF subfamily